MTLEFNLHEKYKNEICGLLNQHDFNCVDYEKEIKDKDSKKPDLKENSHDILIEVKVLFLNEDLKSEGRKIRRELAAKGSSAYWYAETSNFEKHLKDCRKKFRQFPNNKSLVVFINQMEHQEQTLEELMSGQEYFNYSINKDSSPQLNGYGHKDREIRWDKNSEIGALAQYYPKEKKLVIIHNEYADKERIIPPNIFKGLEDIEQKIYHYENGSTSFKLIENENYGASKTD